MDGFISFTTAPTDQNSYPPKYQSDMPLSLLPICSVGALPWWRLERALEVFARAPDRIEVAPK